VPRSTEGRPLTVYISGRAGVAQKGTKAAAEVIGMLRKLNVSVRLVVRGVEPGTEEVQRRILSAAAGGDVEVRPFTTERSELHADLDEADVVVMTSRAEGFGLTAHEAAASGVPTVVPTSSGFGRWLGEPGRFPEHLTLPSLVEQGFVEQVPKELWFEALKYVVEKYPDAQERALRLQQQFLDQEITWEAAVRSLIDEARRLR
ncbi:MAG TPA: glycosyltransferase, partial [Umezawaea sp.]|nr:glycosyltransferase [Umezawaea sp.]